MILFLLAGFMSMACGCAGEREAESLYGLMAEESNIKGAAQENSVGGDSSVSDGLEQEAKTVFVHICGEVLYPGVYEVPADSRINDVLNLAGGFLENADEEYWNLAAPVADGMQIQILSKEEAEIARRQQANQALGLVNINTASVSELATLPGIGESRAKDIVAYRTQNGAFSAKEDIMQVSGIKDSVYQKIADKICIE